MYGAGQERATTVSLQKSAKHGGGSVMLCKCRELSVSSLLLQRGKKIMHP